MPSTQLYESRVRFLKLQSAFLDFEESLKLLSFDENRIPPDLMERFGEFVRSYCVEINNKLFNQASPCIPERE